MAAMIWIDSREPDLMQGLVTSAIGPEHVSVLFLKAADYVIFDRDNTALGIERKTIGDFLHSLASRERHPEGLGDWVYGRFDKQVARMVEHYDQYALLLEGEYSMNAYGHIRFDRTSRGWDRQTKWSHAAIQARIWSLQEHGFKFIWTHSPGETADTLRVLHQRAQEKGLSGATTHDHRDTA
jgi:ERCC4-type nuclease